MARVLLVGFLLLCAVNAFHWQRHLSNKRCFALRLHDSSSSYSSGIFIGDGLDFDDEKIGEKTILRLLDCLTSTSDTDDPEFDYHKDDQRRSMLRENDYSNLRRECISRGLPTLHEKQEMLVALLVHKMNPSIKLSDQMDIGGPKMIAVSKDMLTDSVLIDTSENNTSAATHKIERLTQEQIAEHRRTRPFPESDDFQLLRGRGKRLDGRRLVPIVMDGLQRSLLAIPTQRFFRTVSTAEREDNVARNVLSAYVVTSKELLLSSKEQTSVTILLSDHDFRSRQVRVLADELACLSRQTVIVLDIHRSSHQISSRDKSRLNSDGESDKLANPRYSDQQRLRLFDDILAALDYSKQQLQAHSLHIFAAGETAGIALEFQSALHVHACRIAAPLLTAVAPVSDPDAHQVNEQMHVRSQIQTQKTRNKQLREVLQRFRIYPLSEVDYDSAPFPSSSASASASTSASISGKMDADEALAEQLFEDSSDALKALDAQLSNDPAFNASLQSLLADSSSTLSSASSSTSQAFTRLFDDLEARMQQRYVYNEKADSLTVEEQVRAILATSSSASPALLTRQAYATLEDMYVASTLQASLSSLVLVSPVHYDEERCLARLSSSALLLFLGDLRGGGEALARSEMQLLRLEKMQQRLRVYEDEEGVEVQRAGGMTEAESEEERKARRAAKEVVEEVRLMREEVRRRRALVSLPGATPQSLQHWLLRLHRRRHLLQDYAVRCFEEVSHGGLVQKVLLRSALLLDLLPEDVHEALDQRETETVMETETEEVFRAEPGTHSQAAMRMHTQLKTEAQGKSAEEDEYLQAVRRSMLTQAALWLDLFAPLRQSERTVSAGSVKHSAHAHQRLKRDSLLRRGRGRGHGRGGDVRDRADGEKTRTRPRQRYESRSTGSVALRLPVGAHLHLSAALLTRLDDLLHSSSTSSAEGELDDAFSEEEDGEDGESEEERAGRRRRKTRREVLREMYAQVVHGVEDVLAEGVDSPLWM